MNGFGMLDYAEAARLTGLSESSLRRYVSHRQIPFRKVGKRRVFFLREEIEAWILRNTVGDHGNEMHMPHRGLNGIKGR
jgi:excisionase family DNA binding protein